MLKPLGSIRSWGMVAISFLCLVSLSASAPFLAPAFSPAPPESLAGRPV